MKILVTGVSGQLGYEVVKELTDRGITCKGVGSKDFDLTDFEAAHRVITEYMPDAVIHCGAYTAVDKAEDNKVLCFQVNAGGTANIAKICKNIDAKLVYVSTDYVFPGTGTQYYEPDDTTCPLNFYGQTKWEGEEAVRRYVSKYFVVRISWAFGAHGNNFVKTMLRLGSERESINVVADQVGSPTYMRDLAPLLCDMVMTEKYGTYHATNEGVCSWSEFAEEIFRQAGIHCTVNHISTSDYPTPAKRPANSRLSKEKLVQNGFHKLPVWQDAVRRFLVEIGK